MIKEIIYVEIMGKYVIVLNPLEYQEHIAFYGVH